MAKSLNWKRDSLCNGGCQDYIQVPEPFLVDLLEQYASNHFQQCYFEFCTQQNRFKIILDTWQLYVAG